MKKTAQNILLSTAIAVGSFAAVPYNGSAASVTIVPDGGKDQIGSAIPGAITKSVYANFEKNGAYLLYNKNIVSLYKTPNGTKDGSIAPQMLSSSKRHGDWFLVTISDGSQRWVYYDDAAVELRDIDTKNDKLTLQEDVYLHTNPFAAYQTTAKLAPQSVTVLKQAGDWFYIQTAAGQKGWVTTLKAKYEGVTASFTADAIRGVTYKKMIVPLGNERVRPGLTMKPKYITIHNTANAAVGANALMHANYLMNQAKGAPDRWASWHFTVDDKQVIQHLPLNESGWHAGDDEGAGNRGSIGIEIAENADGNYAKAEENARKLIAYLMREYNIPLSRVVPHQNWSGKDCPHIILGRGSWSSFQTAVQKTYDVNEARYRVVTGGFVGKAAVESALARLKKDTGWQATYESTGQPNVYRIVTTTTFIGQAYAQSKAAWVKSRYGWWMTVRKA
ncbi:N-acetylmuramoyl-L-alanine amidase [Ectobacillus ponti]|uniref:N-acetylmuramoyl-L-alanine amidase n=1 Tax=Ectobacillus ponti TaxID=2961894 RepID=UPI00244CB174|nr:N-acetylmuramoyl-L-alanine amidase [Ectobacillus ponti]